MHSFPEVPHLLVKLLLLQLMLILLFVEMARKRQMKNVMIIIATALMGAPVYAEFRVCSSVWEKRGRHLSAGGSAAIHGLMIKKNVMMGIASVEMVALVTVEWRRGSHVRAPAV